MSEADAARIVAEFSPESQHLYRDRAGHFALPERCGYIATSADPEFPASLQQSFAACLGTPWRRSIAAGHLPMLQEPAALAIAFRHFQAEAPSRS